MDKKSSLSQLDSGQVLKNVHDLSNESLRVTNANASVPPKYSRVETTYNTEGSCTNARFYLGVLPRITEIRTVGDSAASLSSTYFCIYSAGDVEKYYIWFNVNGVGIDPTLPGATGIEIPLQMDDADTVVAAAIRLYVNKLSDFKAEQIGNLVTITNVEKGTSSATTNGGTGFTIVNKQAGTEKLIKSIDIPFDGKVVYLFNGQEKKFHVESVGKSNTNVTISHHPARVVVLQETNKLDSELDEDDYVNIFTHTPSVETNFRLIKIKVDTTGLFRVKVDGVVQDYYRATALIPNVVFDFPESLAVGAAETMDIEFSVDSINLTAYNFFMRAEGYK